MTDTIIAIRKSTIYPNYASEISHYKFSDGVSISKKEFFVYHYSYTTKYYCKTISNKIVPLTVEISIHGERFFKTHPNYTEADNLINIATF